MSYNDGGRGRWWHVGVGVSAALGLGLVIGAPLASALPVSRTNQLADVVAVEGLQADGSTVSGRLVNRTDQTLRDVRLMVRDIFDWANERHPGDDSPGRTGEFTVPGPIPPGGSANFHIDRPPLPDRSDGTFRVEVGVTEVTQIGLEGAPRTIGGATRDTGY